MRDAQAWWLTPRSLTCEPMLVRTKLSRVGDGRLKRGVPARWLTTRAHHVHFFLGGSVCLLPQAPGPAILPPRSGQELHAAAAPPSFAGLGFSGSCWALFLLGMWGVIAVRWGGAMPCTA